MEWHKKNSVSAKEADDTGNWGKLKDGKTARDWMTLEDFLLGRKGPNPEMYFNVVGTHSTLVTGKGKLRKERTKFEFSKIVGSHDEALARVQVYNRWEIWMLEFEEDAMLRIRSIKKPNRREKKYKFQEKAKEKGAPPAPAPKLSCEKATFAGKYTGWDWSKTVKEFIRQLEFVVKDRADNKDVEKTCMLKWREQGRKERGVPRR